MSPLLPLAFLSQMMPIAQAPDGVGVPKTLVIVRRPENASFLPSGFGKPIDLTALAAKAGKAGYLERRSGETLYLFSPEVLPIKLWQEESSARRAILAKVAADGTLNIQADSAEGRLLLGSLSTTKSYTGDLPLRVSPGVSMTLEGGGRAIAFELNAARKPRADIPLAVPDERPDRPQPFVRIYATAQAARGDYVFETLGDSMFSPKGTISRRKIAFGLIEEATTPALEREDEDAGLMYSALAPLAIDERRIPARGTSYATLPPAVRDDIEYAIRNDPKRHGFTDEQDAVKWLASTSVKGTEAWVGLELRTGVSSSSSAMLARRRY